MSWPTHPLRSALLVVCISGCSYFPNHHLVHPADKPAQVLTWSDDIAIDPLLIHIEGARPRGRGPFPAVIVHPEGGQTAKDMRGVIWDLAARGYVAIAADYERRIDGEYQRNLIAWRSAAEVTAILDVIGAYCEIDRDRVGLLGFSQGGVISLLIAAHAPDRVRVVVSYYPVTDFPRWLNKRRSAIGERIAYRVVRWYFYRQSGAGSEAEFDQIMRAASPYYVAGAIEAPALLVHGDRDRTAPVEESQRMADRLAELGKPVRLLVVPGGVHIFNFRQPEQAAAAWDATLQWLDAHLEPQPGAVGPAVPAATRPCF